MIQRKKLIEVALPLEAINAASAREKSIRHGHPSTLHLWWARRPLAAARAVIFAQMVDDPASHSERFPTVEAQEQERKELFDLIEELVQWENTTNEAVLKRARTKIWESWRATCADNQDHPRAAELFNPDKLPAFHDPFAGGGSLPLEAQRLGLEAYASDLNPVAVLINKAMIEIPPKFAGQPPVNPAAREEKTLFQKTWTGAQGLAEDVRYYGQWMRNEAAKRIGHLYPKIEITPEMAQERPDLKPLVGQKLTVIAWLWAHTVKSPNPAFAHIDVPLVSTFMLSVKLGKEVWIEPVVRLAKDGYDFIIRTGGRPQLEETVNRRGAFCLMSNIPIPFEYIRAEAKAGRMSTRLMAVVAEGVHGRVYLPPTQNEEILARLAEPQWKPELEFFQQALGFRIGNYGLTKWSDLFTSRQLVALTTFSDLVQEVRTKVEIDSIAAGLRDDRLRLNVDSSGATAYADAVAVYLAFQVDQLSNHLSKLCAWHVNNEQLKNTFARQTLSMTWDYAETNPLSNSTGSLGNLQDRQVKGIQSLAPYGGGHAAQADAAIQHKTTGKAVSTDPPYYDNIGYADLSDFFYVWLRRTLSPVFPELFATLAVPKVEELVATAHRHGSKLEAEAFFLDGMTRAMQRLAEQAHPACPVTIYYAFKQSETENTGTASTGWETFLAAVIRAGFVLTGTWPIRTEQTAALKVSRNALATSIVLVCRPRPTNAPTATRREFLTALKAELPTALAHLQRGNIAPVDLAQAAIGPGMAVYTRYAQVLDASGRPLSVREALALINQTLDETLAEQEGDFDADTRWALAWFEQFGFTDGEFGMAETLSKAKNTSVSGMVEAGILASRGGKVRLLRPEELPADWDPATDRRLTVWEMVHQLVRALDTSESAAATLVARLGSQADTARELAYRLYTLCERKKRAQEALAYNSLVQSWPEIVQLAREGGEPRTQQAQLFEEE